MCKITDKLKVLVVVNWIFFLHIRGPFDRIIYSQILFWSSVAFLLWVTSSLLRFSKTHKFWSSEATGGDSSNKGCFGRKTNLFWESGDFAGNRETWEIFREIWDIFGTLSKDLILHVIKQYIYSDMHPVYALYSMYFDTWKRLNSPWYEKTNQQRFQLK